jgi:hypothetical protein
MQSIFDKFRATLENSGHAHRHRHIRMDIHMYIAVLEPSITNNISIAIADLYKHILCI